MLNAVELTTKVEEVMERVNFSGVVLLQQAGKTLFEYETWLCES